ncbi:MAG TPA: hypothetical protein IAB53_03380 [Candidatus Scybalocola faecipullorum]|nr:hypothetical protein [Candidatus Scybalocola faecipullorum]
MNSSFHMTELDEKLYDGTAQMLKAAIPYAHKEQAKALAVAAKILELKKALASFGDSGSEISICALPEGRKPTPEELLTDLKKYCEPSQAEMIDRMLGILRMGKLYEKYQELAQTPEFNTILNSLGGLNGAFSNVSNRENPPVSSGRPSESNTDMENSLKAMLTPHQLELFERLKASMNQPHD